MAASIKGMIKDILRKHIDDEAKVKACQDEIARMLNDYIFRTDHGDMSGGQ